MNRSKQLFLCAVVPSISLALMSNALVMRRDSRDDPHTVESYDDKSTDDECWDMDEKVETMKHMWQAWVQRENVSQSWAEFAASHRLRAIVWESTSPCFNRLAQDPFFQGYALVGDDKILCTGWGGRTGNHIRAIKNAVMKAINDPQYSQVCLLQVPEDLKEDFINADAGGGCFNVETAPEDAMWRWTNGTNTYEDQRLPMLKYLPPIFSGPVHHDCAKTQSFSGLTVHLRSGDLLENVEHSQSHLAPCSFIDYVIDHFGYEAVNIVTEPDLKHPCVNATLDRHPDKVVTIQTGSVTEAACSLMHAKHMLHGTYSSFAVEFGWLLNSQAETVHFPYTYDAFAAISSDTSDMPNDPDCAQKGTSYTPACEIHRYDIDGIFQPRTPEQKLDWIMSDVGIREVEKQCNYMPESIY